MMSGSVSSLGRRLILLTVGIGLVLATCLAGIDAVVASHLRAAGLDSDIEELVQVNLPGLREALWLGDTPLVRSQLRGLVNYRDIALAEITPPGQQVITVGTPPPPATATIEKRVEVTRSFHGQEVPLGTLVVTVDLSILRHEWQTDMLGIFVTQMLQITLLAGCLMILYQRLVGRRIDHIATRLDLARHRIGGNLSDSMPVASSRTGDELDLLAATLDQLLAEQTHHMCQLGDAHDLLEQRVADRTQALSAEVAEHQRTRTELARSNQDLEQFAYAVSHDLQEPLRMVASYLQLLVRRYGGRLDSDADEYIGFAVDGAKRMHRMINDLLEYSRVHTLGVDRQPTDSAEALGIALNNLELVLQDHRARISIDVLPVVAADSGQLIRLFQNLLGNALKYCSEDRIPEIEIGSEQQGSDWVFHIRDNGIGIEPEHFERIFGVFQRLNKNHRFEGTGIGLALCKRIVERHGGSIWVQSQPGEGSTFFFSLPVAAMKNGGLIP